MPGVIVLRARSSSRRTGRSCSTSSPPRGRRACTRCTGARRTTPSSVARRVTSMQKRVRRAATVAGVNGDLFAAPTATRPGALIRGGVLDSGPVDFRSSHRRRHGRCPARRARRASPAPGRDPASAGRSAQRDAATRIARRSTRPPGADDAGRRPAASSSSSSRSPRRAEHAVDRRRHAVRHRRQPADPAGRSRARRTRQRRPASLSRGSGRRERHGAAHAHADPGPTSRRGRRRPDRRRATGSRSSLARGLHDRQLAYRASAHGASGRRADGRILLVAVDGGQPGYSIGHDELRAGADDDAPGAVSRRRRSTQGGSTTMAFDGKLLNRPSDPAASAPVADALTIFYYGVYAPALRLASFRRTADGVDDTQTFAYKLVRPSTVTATLTGPDGIVVPARCGLARSPAATRSAGPVRVSPKAPGPRDGRGRRSRAPLDCRPPVRPQQHARLRDRESSSAPARHGGLQARAACAASRCASRLPAAASCRPSPLELSRQATGRSRGGGRPGSYVFSAHRHERGRSGGAHRSFPAPPLASAQCWSPRFQLPHVADRRPRALRRLLLMAIDAVLPAASELVMVYAGALAAGAFAGQHVALFGARISSHAWAYVAVALAGTLGYLVGSIVGWAIGLRRAAVARAARPLAPPRRGQVRSGRSAGSTATATRRCSSADHARRRARSSRSRPGSSGCRSGATPC